MGSYIITKKWREAFKARDPEGYRKYRADEARKWRDAHPDVSFEIQTRHRKKNIDTIRIRNAKAKQRMRLNNPDTEKNSQQRYKQRQEKIKEQIAGRSRGTVCELCDEIGTTVFDHDHISGNFRGWICDRCNRVLGCVNDNPILLSKMILYLEKHNGKTKL